MQTSYRFLSLRISQLFTDTWELGRLWWRRSSVEAQNWNWVVWIKFVVVRTTVLSYWDLRYVRLFGIRRAYLSFASEFQTVFIYENPTSSAESCLLNLSWVILWPNVAFRTDVHGSALFSPWCFLERPHIAMRELHRFFVMFSFKGNKSFDAHNVTWKIASLIFLSCNAFHPARDLDWLLHWCNISTR